MSAHKVTCSGLTNVGRNREHNEDYFAIDGELNLAIVCDGMGGHAAGEVASELAGTTILAHLRDNRALLEEYLIHGGEDGALVTRKQITELVEMAVNRASARVFEEAHHDLAKRGMGTTVVILLVLGNSAFITYVGDSRAYLLRDNTLRQLTEDHNVYNELVNRRKMPKERVEEIAPKNALTRCVGVYEHAEPDSLVLDLAAGDRFLLCSDGLSGYFEDDMEQLGLMLRAPDGNVAAERMIAAANAEGGKDNITAVVLTVEALGEGDEERARRLHRKHQYLRELRLFKPLNERELLRLLQLADVLPFADGETIIREGERGQELFIVLEGEVVVSAGGNELARLHPGDHFGEMALIRKSPRSATVTSAGSSELIVLRRGDLFEHLRAEPTFAVKLLWQFVQVLAERLDEKNRELGAVRNELLAEELTEEVFRLEDDGEDRKTLVLPPLAPSQRLTKDN